MKYSGCNEVAESKVDYEKEYLRVNKVVKELYSKLYAKDVIIEALENEVVRLKTN